MAESNPSTPLPNIGTQYLLVTVFLFAVGMTSVIVVSMMRPNADNSILITAILGFTGTTLGSILTWMKSQETHASVNSRMDEFIKKFEESSQIKQDKARTEGEAAGRRQGREAADARTDVLAGHAIVTVPAVVVDPNPLREIQKNTKETVETLKEIKDK